MGSTFMNSTISMAATGVAALQTKQLKVMGAWTVRCSLASRSGSKSWVVQPKSLEVLGWQDGHP